MGDRLSFDFPLILNNVTEIKLAVTTLHRNALLSHDRSDKLGRRNVKTRVIDPV